MESRWDSEQCTNDSFLGKGQRGEGPRICILMDINNLYIRSVFNKLSLGITGKTLGLFSSGGQQVKLQM